MSDADASAPETDLTRVVVADDHAVVRSGLRMVLEAEDGIEVVAEVGDAEAAGRAVRAYHPHVLVLDLNPELGARMAAEPPPSGPPDGLTERELEVLRMIALGHTNTEIAGQLYLSVRTVESHRAHIQQKVRRSTRAELVRYALDHKLIEQGD
jgi:two-component system, NarL family, response regulator NreC